MKIVCPSCGSKNKLGNKFCSECGSSLAAGKVMSTCPACGADIPADARFCSKCGAKITPETPAYPPKDFDKNRRWNRTSADFARKFDVGDLKGVFQKSLTVEQGTKALIIQGGVYKGILPAGYYTFNSTLASHLPIKLDQRISVIIVDATEIPLTIAIAKDQLRTRDSIHVSLAGRITLQITDPLKFLENFLKGAERISVTDIENRISELVRLVLHGTVAQHVADELYGNRALIAEIETALTRELNAKLNAFGLAVLDLIGLGFDEGAWKQVLDSRERSNVETAEAKAESEKRMKLRSFENAEKVDEIQGDDAIDKARQDAAHRHSDAELDHTLDQDQKRFEHEQDKRKREFEEDLYEIDRLRDIQLKTREKHLEMDRENERLTMENRSKVPIEVLISIMGGNDPVAKEIAKLELAKRAVSLTPEQILAVQAAESPAAAEALKAKYNADEQKEFNRRTEEQYRENAANMKDVMNTALNAMGSTATARATAQNPGATVVAGGFGAPVVVNQQTGKKCMKCGADVANDDLFCPECGARLT